MLGLRRSGKRRRNRDQQRHADRQRDAKQLDRALEVAPEDSPASDPALPGQVERRRPSSDVERPYPYQERRGSHDR